MKPNLEIGSKIYLIWEEQECFMTVIYVSQLGILCRKGEQEIMIPLGVRFKSLTNKKGGGRSPIPIENKKVQLFTSLERYKIHALGGRKTVEAKMFKFISKMYSEISSQ